MKILILALLLVTTKTYASGCNPHDVSLIRETPIVSLGDHYGYYRCQNNKCWVNTVKDGADTSESHHLLKAVLGGETSESVEIFIPKLEVKIYRQYFSSSCSDVIEYVIGTEYEGVRYRSIIDRLWL